MPTLETARSGSSRVLPGPQVTRSEAPENRCPSSVPLHRDRNVLSVLLGIVGFFSIWGCTALVVTPGSVLGTFLDLPAALLVLLTPVTLLTAVYGWAGVVDACLWIFRKPATTKAAAEAVTFFQLGAAFALAGGFLTAMIGMVLVLRHAGEVGRIGPGMAAALLSQLYGVFIAVICIAVAAYIARRHQPGPLGAPVAHRAASIAGITTIAGTLTAMIVFGILMLSLAPNF